MSYHENKKNSGNRADFKERCMRFLLIFIMFACSLSAFTQNISSQVDSVVIKYVSWDLITDISVDCTNY